VTPANRGEYTRFGHSVYYRGTSLQHYAKHHWLGDEDCITQDEKNMDLDKVKTSDGSRTSLKWVKSTQKASEGLRQRS
jgi:hypothetical protein